MAGDVLLEPRLGGGRAPEDLAARPQALVLEVLLLLVRILTGRVGVLQILLWVCSIRSSRHLGSVHKRNP